MASVHMTHLFEWELFFISAKSQEFAMKKYAVFSFLTAFLNEFPQVKYLKIRNRLFL